MAYGQHSPMGGYDRNKAQMLDIVSRQGLPAKVASSRKGGKNTLLVTLEDGSRYALLHETIILAVSADGRTVTLNDGGWATPTTRRRIGEVSRLFGLPGIDLWNGRPKADHCLPGPYLEGTGRDPSRSIYFDRTVTLEVHPDGYRLPEGAQPVDVPMLRAVAEDRGTTFAVEYRDGAIRSTSGDKVDIGPAHLLFTLHHLLAIAKRGLHRYTMRGLGEYTLWDTSEDILKGAYQAAAGSGGREVYVGCHGFRTQDVRQVLRRLEREHPKAAKAARKSWRAFNKPRLARLEAEAKAEAERKAAQRAATLEARNQGAAL